MMKLFGLLCLLCSVMAAPCQQAPATTATTYALVIGISKYHEQEIPALQFADRDARVFADYLKSVAGGSVPAENIQLLVNEQATAAAVSKAIYWLTVNCKKDDRVFFYFSGHGDVENTTMYKNGFLICYDSPPNNYVQLSLSIDYLNDIANTLSVQTQANVVLITDACHSGKLAGSNFKGNMLVGEQLRAVKNKEIRITSCAPNQLSNEMRDWGGGRGVFSYYLVNGLLGLGDRGKDGIVTVDDIQHYLDSSFATDPVLKRERIVQNPVLNGRGNFVLAKVDAVGARRAEEILTADRLQIPELPSTPPAEESMDVKDYFFEKLKTVSFEAFFRSLHADTLQANAIVPTVINKLKDSLPEAGKKVLLQLQADLQQSTIAQKRFNDKLATILQEKGQQVVNLYLNGDAAELERRNYYDENIDDYSVYVDMFDVALKLTPPGDKYQITALQVMRHYFAAVALRLQMPRVANTKPLIETAIFELNQALNLEENAAYIYNELAILYYYKRDVVQAQKYFIKATIIAPEWPVPWANLSGLYGATNQLQKGFDAVERAKKLQPGLPLLYVNEANLYEKKGNLLMAEELQRKSIELNSRHYLPYERLGGIYIKTTDYALADSFLHEAQLKKLGLDFGKPLDEFSPDRPIVVLAKRPLCPVGNSGKDDAQMEFLRGLENTYEMPVEAEKNFKIAITIEKTHPIAYYYLGMLMYRQKRWQEAEYFLKKAIVHYIDADSFYRYVQPFAASLPADRECLAEVLRNAHLSEEYYHMHIADAYRKWRHYDEAVAHYRQAIKLNNRQVFAYIQLWTLLEFMERFKDAEKALIENYLFNKSDETAADLNGFYDRMIGRVAENESSYSKAEWHYKAGDFLYKFAAEEPDKYLYDRKETEPDKATERYAAIFDSSWVQVVERYDSTQLVARAKHITYPLSNAIKWLRVADSLVSDEDESAAIAGKLGDLYTWIGLPQKATIYFAKAAAIKPHNASTRMKLADTYAASYHYQSSMLLMDTLYARNEINLDQQLTLAKYYIHSGDVQKGRQLAGETTEKFLELPQELTSLFGKSAMFEGKLKDAVGIYKQMDDNATTNYTIARLYAQLNNAAESFKWLQLALANRFNYVYILHYDPALSTLRHTSKWAQLIKNYPLPNLSVLPDAPQPEETK